MTTGRRNLIRIGCLVLALLLALAGYAALQQRRANALQRQLELRDLYALEEAAAGAVRLDLALEKSVFANTPLQRSSLAAQIWREAAAVKTALAVLPFERGLPEQTALFLSQAGEYAMALARKSLRGEEIAPQEQEQLAALRTHAAALGRLLTQLEGDIASGGSGWEVLAAAPEEASEPRSDTPAGSAGLDGMEAGFAGYASLVYDGPCSDHTAEREPLATAGLPVVDRYTARATAAELLGTEAAELRDGYDENSALPLYCFEGADGFAAVCRSGGFPVWMSRLRPIDRSAEPLTPEAALAAAGRFLQRMGFDGMQSNHYKLEEGMLTASFAFLQEGVTCYPDLVQVGVALDSGEVLFFDAHEYLYAHTERQLSAAALTRAEAAACLSPLLRVRSSRMALIPSPGGRELLCYEFTCSGPQEEQVLVYINAENGGEEALLLLTEDEHGILTA